MSRATSAGENLSDEIDRLVQLVQTSFPDVPFNPALPVGMRTEWTNEAGQLQSNCNDDCGQAEAFFRDRDERELLGVTQEETRQKHREFFAANYPVKRWTSLVGEALDPWVVEEYSYLHLSPEARAYYLPAYLLTCLQLMRPSVAKGPPTDPESVPLLLLTIFNMLEPPEGFAIWAALANPHTGQLFADGYPLSRKEFFEFISQLSEAQRDVARQFVGFAADDYLKSLPHLHRDAPGVVLVRKCWAAMPV